MAMNVSAKCPRFMYYLDLACLAMSCTVFIRRYINGLLVASPSFWSGTLKTGGGEQVRNHLSGNRCQWRVQRGRGWFRKRYLC